MPGAVEGLLLVILDLASGLSTRTGLPVRPGQVTRDGLCLRLTLVGGPIRGGAQLVTVQAELKNVGDRTRRVLWQPSSAPPLSLLIDGTDHPDAPMALSYFEKPVELEAGQTVTISRQEVLSVGKHWLSWRYAPSGRRIDGGPDLSGLLVTERLEVSVPIGPGPAPPARP
jgi:hypothetical protein